MLGRLNILVAVLVSELSAGSDDCYAAYVKSMIKVRDEAVLGPIPEKLEGAERIAELLKNGVPKTQLMPDMAMGERIDLHIVCKCLFKPKLVSDGNYLAAKIGLHQVSCNSTLPFSTVPYTVTEPETCFAASIRASQRQRGVVSSFLLSTTSTTNTVLQDGQEIAVAATKVRQRKSRIFRKGEFRLGALGYADVCNEDRKSQSGDSTEVNNGSKLAKGQNPLSSHYDKDVDLMQCAEAANSVHHSSTSEFYY